jgi:hypothetical protein
MREDDGLQLVIAYMVEQLREHSRHNAKAAGVEQDTMVIMHDEVLVGRNAVFLSRLTFIQENEFVILGAKNWNILHAFLPWWLLPLWQLDPSGVRDNSRLWFICVNLEFVQAAQEIGQFCLGSPEGGHQDICDIQASSEAAWITPSNSRQSLEGK